MSLKDFVYGMLAYVAVVVLILIVVLGAIFIVNILPSPYDSAAIIIFSLAAIFGGALFISAAADV